MGILTELCMVIDLNNSNNKIKKRRTLLDFIREKMKENSIKKVINAVTVDYSLIKNSMIEEFLYIYSSTKDTIKIKDLTINYNETNDVLSFKYINRKSSLALTLTKGNSYKINVVFTDLAPGAYPVSFTVFDTFYYNGSDKKRVAIMKYANDVVRTFMRDYFLLRLKRNKEI